MPMPEGGGETRLTDEPLAAEIELLGEVIAAAGTHAGQLSTAEIDEVLGAGDGGDADDLDDLDDLDDE
jgi:hypothetical protein